MELYNGTVAPNIARMKVEFSPDMVVEAAKNAGAHEMMLLILRLPQGYRTDIGIGGSNSSGGQRQRVALPRCFCKPPKILVLDGPNANLDKIWRKYLKR